MCCIVPWDAGTVKGPAERSSNSASGHSGFSSSNDLAEQGFSAESCRLAESYLSQLA